MRFLAICVGLTLLCVAGAAQNLVRRSTYLGQLRFSPDRHYVLAHDDAEIVVLTTQPLAILFRIPAVKSTPAQFTPDSSEIAFLSSITRVSPPAYEPEKLNPHLEWWSVAGKNRVGFFDAPADGCGTLVLSPDGRVLACDDTQGTLKLFDVPACKVLYEKRQFVRQVVISGPDEFPRLYWGDLGEASIDFSPDGRYLWAKGLGGESLLWDVRAMSAVRHLGHSEACGAIRSPVKSL
jgi:WD40 repeat protein